MLLRKPLKLHSMQACFALCLFGTSFLFSEEIENNKPLPIGNFSVPTVTQLAPLVSFGQHLIGQYALLPQLTGAYTQGHKSYTNDLVPNIIYGIRDDFSLTFGVPFTPRSRTDSSHSAGFEDMFLTLEYAYFNRTRPDYVLQGSLVADVQFPTGSSTKVPPTGNGSFAYLLGTTLAYLSANWYAFISPGVNLTTTHHSTKFGNSYLYDWGFARYIDALSPPGWIFDLMLEFNGAYIQKDKIRGVKDPNSGGNVIFITPSIWMSSERWVLQWGVSMPILQSLNGHQNKILYSIGYNLGLAFQF